MSVRASKFTILMAVLCILLFGCLFGYGLSVAVAQSRGEGAAHDAVPVMACQPQIEYVPRPYVVEVQGSCEPAILAVTTPVDSRPAKNNDPKPTLVTVVTSIPSTPDPTSTPEPEPLKTKHPNKGGGNGCEGADPGNHPERGHDDETPCL